MKVRYFGGNKSALLISPEGDVAKIEVTDIAPPDPDDDSLVPEFFRTIRITGVGNEEVLEIFCSATSEEALQMKQVPEPGDIERPVPDPMDWLTPAKRKRG